MRHSQTPESTKLRLLTRNQLDGRTSAARQFDDVARGIAQDLGGEDQLSTIEKHLVEAFAGVSLHLTNIHARLIQGEKVDLGEHSIAVSSMVRIAARVGLNRIPRDVEPTLKEYLAARDRADDIEEPA